MLEVWCSDDETEPDFDDSLALEQESCHMEMIQKNLDVHALPTVLIGFGAATFLHKLWALLHSARLEVFTNAGLQEWCSSLLTVASDYGVERRLVDVDHVQASEVVGWFEDTRDLDVRLLAQPEGAEVPRQAEADQVHANHDMFEVPDFAPAQVDQLVPIHAGGDEDDFEVQEFQRLTFENLLGIPGLHHVVDNATKGLEDVMQSYKDNVFLAQQVCRLLRKRDTQPKLIERCFSRGLGPEFVDVVRGFEGWIHPGRWGTVAFSIPELLKVKRALVSCWDEQMFLQGYDAAGVDEARRRSTAELAQDVSKAVQDPAWWGWVCMLEVVCSLLREHIAWAESCPCHYRFLHLRGARAPALPAKVKAQFARCPCRGKRAAELSSGEFLDLMGRLWGVSTVHVLQALPADVSQRQRRHIMQEFDRARTHLSFYFTMKLSHLQEMPWKVLQVSHSSEIIAQIAARDALTSDCQHVLSEKLRGPLRQSCEQWLEGNPLFSPGNIELQKFVGSLRFVPTSERAIEGQHAKVHRHGLGRPNHTEHFQSFFVRSAEMAQAMMNEVMPLERFAWYCQAARNHHEASVAVGISGHPALGPAHKHRRRNTMCSQVIYHADPFTLYSAAAPDVSMRPPPQGDRNLGAPDQPAGLEDGPDPRDGPIEGGGFSFSITHVIAGV